MLNANKVREKSAELLQATGNTQIAQYLTPAAVHTGSILVSANAKDKKAVILRETGQIFLSENASFHEAVYETIRLIAYHYYTLECSDCKDPDLDAHVLSILEERRVALSSAFTALLESLKHWRDSSLSSGFAEAKAIQQLLQKARQDEGMFLASIDV